MPDLRVSELRALLQGQCPGLLHELVPGMRREGHVYSAPNPRRGDGRHGSFKLWSNGAWREYDEPEDTGKGDVLGLVAYVAGHDPKTREGRRHAIQWAKRRLGLDDMPKAQLLKVRRDLEAEAVARKARMEAEEHKRTARLYRRALDIWRAAAPADAAIGRYLQARGIDRDAIAHPVPSLRLHPALDHWAMPHKGDGGAPWRGPAVVARVCHADGRFAAVHCTFLRDDYAGKAPMLNAKLMLGAVKGAFVPLTLGLDGLTIREAAAPGQTRAWLVAGEGIETSLAIAQAVPEARVWACLSLGNLAHVPLDPAFMAGLVVALDNDTKPEALRQRDKVLDTLGARCDALKLPLRTMAAAGGNDFADVMKGDQDG